MSTVAYPASRGNIRRPFATILRAWGQWQPADLAIPAAMCLVWGLGNSIGWSIGHESDNIPQTILYFLAEAFLPMALLALGLRLADDPTATAPPRASHYAVAALVAAVAGEALFELMAPHVGLSQCACSADAWPKGARVANMLPDGILICGFIAAGYYFRRRSAQRAAALRAVQLEGTELTRQTLESKLQAMQARVEPEFLFDTLVEVQRTYDTDMQRADRLLDQLIVYLRAALPQLHDVTSTLGKEIGLARAYLAILKMRHGERLAYTIDAPRDAEGAPLAPMLILPLIDFALASEPNVSTHRRAIDIVASTVPGGLRLIFCSEGAHHPDGRGAPLLDSLRARLLALYGARATLDVRVEGVMTLITIEVAVEHAHGDHR